MIIRKIGCKFTKRESFETSLIKAPFVYSVDSSLPPVIFDVTAYTFGGVVSAITGILGPIVRFYS